MDKIYGVAFYKRLTSATGHVAEPCQGVVEVRAPCEGRAVELVRRRFEELTATPTWWLRADYERVECLPARNRISGSVWQRSLLER